MALSLFIIRADNEDGEDMDALAWAATPEEAKNWWREYYSLPHTTVPEWVAPVPGAVPWVGTRPGVIHWGDILDKKISWPKPDDLSATEEPKNQ